MTRSEFNNTKTVNVKVTKLKEGDIIKSVYNLIEVVKINVRAKTTQVFYKMKYDGFQPSKPFQYWNDETVRKVIKDEGDYISMFDDMDREFCKSLCKIK